MSAASSFLSEDQFLCPICLDVFTDPVGTPCGHSFCKRCITQHWDDHAPPECAICKKSFSTRPELQVNVFMSEMVSEFRQRLSTRSSSEQQAAKPGEVPCDVCTGPKQKALKSCLVCLVSYCHNHLEPHLTTPGLKKHQLMEPVLNLETRTCRKHDRLLEMFCQTDQTCVCMLCTVLEHKAHTVVPVKEEHEAKKAEVEKTEAELEQMIQQRRLKISDLRQVVKVSRDSAGWQMADSVHLLTELKNAIKQHQNEVMETIKEKHKETQRRAEGFMEELEQEISELKKRHAELKQLSQSEDHLNLLQNFSSLNAAPPTKDWTEVRVQPRIYRQDMRSASAALMKTVESLLMEAELRTVRQFAADVTLDPDTAHNWLILSEDRKQVHCGSESNNAPDNPQRFLPDVCVLGQQVVSSGQFYYEVQVKDKTQWLLGVAKESVNRKGSIDFYPRNGFWMIFLINGNEYYASEDPPVLLSLESQPEKIGVFIDYDGGLVSFYDVSPAHLIYTFTDCSFTEKLLSLFSPCDNEDGKNPAPLIICPVNTND